MANTSIASSPRDKLSLSIIIPALNEAAFIGLTLRELAPVERIEVIVSDGGSTDGTLDRIAGYPGVRAISAPPGRAHQMNAAAAVARGTLLLFLHADSLLHHTSVPRMLEAMHRRPEAVGGAFRFRLDSTRRRYRLIEKGVALRVRFLGLPYGDQGLFVRREAFEALGGFRPLPIAEDIDFVRRMRRLGRLLFLDDPVITSARRWEEHGFLRTTLRNWYYLALSAAGLLQPEQGERGASSRGHAIPGEKHR